MSFFVDRAASERAFVEDAAIVGRQRDDARNETRFGRLPQDFIDSHRYYHPISTTCRGRQIAVCVISATLLLPSETTIASNSTIAWPFETTLDVIFERNVSCSPTRTRA